MKKRIALLLTAALLLAGCDAAQNSSSQSSSAVSSSSDMGNWSSNSVDKGAVQTYYQDAKIVSFSGGIISFVKSGALPDLYPGAKAADITSDMTSMGEGIHPLYFLDDGRRVVGKSGQVSEYGIYNPADKSYRKLFDSISVIPLLPVNSGETFVYTGVIGVVQNRWILFTVDNMEDTARALCLCDVNTGEQQRIFTYTPPEVINGSITSVYNLSNPVIDGGDIYWDDTAAIRLATFDKVSEADVNIWHYSTDGGKAEKVVTQGWRPFVYKGELYYYGSGSKPYTSTTSSAGIYKAGSSALAVIDPQYIRQVYGGDGLAALGTVTLSSYDVLRAKDSRLPLVTVNDKGYASTIMTSLLIYKDYNWQPVSVTLGDTINWVKTDGRFVLWGGKGLPTFYDSKKGCLVTLPIEAFGKIYYSCFLTADKLIYSVSSQGVNGERLQYFSVDKASLS